MYIPPSMGETDPDRIRAIIEAFPFATLMTWGADCQVTHLPMQPAADDLHVLWGHVARANPHARVLARGPEALVIFQGPHGYISPSWYVSDGQVPTWNYVAVHARGRVVPVDGAEAIAAVRRQVEFYERTLPAPWSPPDEVLDRRIRGVQVFRVEVTGLECKRKLGQNRSLADRQSARRVLEQSDSPGDRELARWMADSETDQS